MLFKSRSSPRLPKGINRVDAALPAIWSRAASRYLVSSLLVHTPWAHAQLTHSRLFNSSSHQLSSRCPAGPHPINDPLLPQEPENVQTRLPFSPARTLSSSRTQEDSAQNLANLTSGPPSPSPSLLPKSPSSRAFGLPFLCPLRPKVKAAAACRCPLLRQFRSTCAPSAHPSSWPASRKDWFWLWLWLWILRFPNLLAEVLAGARLLVWAEARGDSEFQLLGGLHCKGNPSSQLGDWVDLTRRILFCFSGLLHVGDYTDCVVWDYCADPVRGG
jgi:hypothetical protein